MFFALSWFFSFCYLYISNPLLAWWKCIDVIIQILVRHSGQIFVPVGLVFKSKRWKYHPTLAQIMFNDIIICILIGTHGELCRYIKKDPPSRDIFTYIFPLSLFCFAKRQPTSRRWHHARLPPPPGNRGQTYGLWGPMGGKSRANSL